MKKTKPAHPRNPRDICVALHGAKPVRSFVMAGGRPKRDLVAIEGQQTRDAIAYRTLCALGGRPALKP